MLGGRPGWSSDWVLISFNCNWVLISNNCHGFFSFLSNAPGRRGRRGKSVQAELAVRPCCCWCCLTSWPPRPPSSSSCSSTWPEVGQGLCSGLDFGFSFQLAFKLVSPGIVTTGGGMTKVSILKLVMFGMYDPVPFDPGLSQPCSPGMKLPSRAWNKTVCISTQ